MSANDVTGWYVGNLDLGLPVSANLTESPASELIAPAGGPTTRAERLGPTDAVDRRAAYRLELAPGRAHVELAGQARADLGDISALGGRLVKVSGATSFPGGHLPATVHLAHESPFQVDLRVVRTTHGPSGAPLPLGFCFDSLTPDSLRSLSRFMVREYLDRSSDVSRFVESTCALRNQRRESIARIFLASAIRDQQPLQLYRGGTLLGAQIQITALGVERGIDTLVGFVRGDLTELSAGLDLTFVLPGPSSVFLFRVPMLECRRRRIVLPMPGELIQTGFRASRRTAVADGETFRISFQHPHLPERAVDEEVVDLAARGLALSMRWDQDLLLPGDRLPSMQLTFPDGTSIEASGTVRGLRHAPQASVRFGIELLDFATPEQHQLWHRFVFQQMHPRLSMASKDDLDRVWDVYESSSYVEKWLPSGRAEQVRREFKGAWSELAPESGRLLLVNQNRAAVGTIAANQMYPRTWLMHGLAVEKAQRQQGGREHFLDLTRELYSGIMYTLHHIAGCQYFLSYFQQDKAWNQRLYGDFARNYVATSDQLYDPTHVLRRRCSDPVPPSGPRRGVRITRASAADRALISREAQRALPDLLIDGLSLREKEIDLRTFSAASASSGLARKREVFLAREDDEPVFAAVCESATGSINIFGLTNLCWTIPLRARLPAEDTYRALMAEVARYYQARGVADFLLFEERQDRLGLLSALGFSSIGPAVRWLAKVQVLPAWLAYLEAELATVRS